MNKIYGDAQVIQRAQNAKPGDPVSLINWDAISQLPDQYEVIVSEVKFNLENDFSDVGNKTYMPNPSLMYKIAEAKGIKGGSDSISEAIYEDVDISEMTMDDAPVFQRMLVGYRCRKYSTVMEEDGTERRSSVCTIDYNVWNRVSEMWSAEEVATNGYADVQNGTYKAFGKDVTGPHYYIQKGQYRNAYAVKYGTKWARKKHFKSELKFAMQKAETKAHEKTIRELAGLMTGYKAAELQEGRLIFAKVRRSREWLQAESAARLSAISQGIEPSHETQKMLFGGVPQDMPVSASATPDEINRAEDAAISAGESQSFESYSKEQSTPAYQRLIDAIDSYNQQGLIPEVEAMTAQGIVGWVESKGADAEADEQYWPKAIGILKKIEDGIKPELRVKHDLY